MILTSLSLQSFRNYKKTIIDVSPATTLIFGPNASGKTNIIEAAFTLATGKSFRADKDSEMIMWGEEVGRVTAQVGETELEVRLTHGMVGSQKAPLKKYTVNGVPRRVIDFIGNLRTVLFWPEDLELITNSPSLRRRYLDRVLIQVDREYRRDLFSYERGLRQRNRLLDLINEGKASRSQLVFWNQLLIKTGGYITDTRAAYCDFINRFHVSNVTYQVEYDKSVISESRLDQYKDEEVAAKATLVGPQRDDIHFKFKIQSAGWKTKRNSMAEEFIDLSKYGSRGEQRLGILWLKLAELSFVQKKTGDRPVLLLDDIFSELDDSHRKYVLDLIKKQQTIITTAENDVPSLLKSSNILFKMIQLPIV